MLTELPLSLTAFLCCCGLLVCDRRVFLQLRKSWAELLHSGYDGDGRDEQLILDERRQVQAVVLQRCAPYMIVICLASFACCFVALILMPECWRLVIELDYLAMSSNVIGAIFLYRHLLPGARQKLHDWQLAGAFYLPWVCVTFLQIANFSCGDEARDGYYSTRLVYFCYRALLSVALMCPFQCTVAELICSGMVAADVQRSEARAVMMSIELLFLLLIFAGTCFLGQRMIDWAFANARKAEEAFSALVDARLGLIEKLCDAEVELSGDLKMLEASASWGSRMGIHLASFEGSFLDVVDEEDEERVLTFLRAASSEGASSCIQASLRTFANDRLDARLYHAAQSGRSDACQHRLAVIFLGNTEPPVATIVAKPTSEVSDDFSSDCEHLFHPLVSAERSLGPASDTDGEMTDTLVCSESIADRSQGSRTTFTRNTFRPGSDRNVCRTHNKGTQTDAQPAKRRADTSDAACQTAGIVRPPVLPQTSQPSSRPQSSDRKVRSHRQLAFAGDVVPNKRLIIARTCQLMLLEDARKMNVRGSGCCAYHVIMSYLHKTVKSMTKSPCRQLEFHSDWQCAICHALHSFEEDQESDADDGKFWCDVCGCTDVPAEPETAPSSMDAEAMSDGPASSFEDVATSSEFSS